MEAVTDGTKRPGETTGLPHPLPVAVLLYPGCVFQEIALAVEVLAPHRPLRYLTPDGAVHRASNGARLQADGDYGWLDTGAVTAVLVPGGDPGSIVPSGRARAGLQAAAARGAWLAGICGGNLVLAAAGVMDGCRGTHNYTAEHASPEAVALTAPYWAGLRFERANLVVDAEHRRITAQPWADRDLAAALAQALGVLDPAAAEDLRTYPQRRRYP